MFKRIGLGVLGAIILAAPASAQVATQPIHVINEAHVSARALRFAELAVRDQLNHEVRRAWHTPRVIFAKTGWRVYVTTSARLESVGGGDAQGAHLVSADGQPYAMVVPGQDVYLSAVLSHELIEMLVDPYDNRVINHYLVEPCDPVEGALYEHHQWALYNRQSDNNVSDFVLPGWFTSGSHRPWDYEHLSAGAFDYDIGRAIFIDPATGNETPVKGAYL